jgi:[ribosomal protein S5]-alanine N-acetyltransferase
MTAPTVLRTTRLLLRPFEAGDVADALAYRDDGEFARFLPHIPQPFTARDAEGFIALNMAEPWDRAPTFAVVLGDAEAGADSAPGHVIGTVNLDLSTVTPRTAMLGYAIGRAWWGQGIAVEAAAAVMAWGVATFGLTRIWASTDIRHLRSQRVLEKLGMRREGVVLREHRGRAGEEVWEAVYGSK